MAIVYFDSSAFVKLVLDEDGTDVVVALWDGCDVAVSSRIAYPEVCAALAAAERNLRLGVAAMRTVRREWDEYWAAVRPVELTGAIARHAGRLVSAHALRGADGVHLASALVFGDADPVVAAWDGRLARSASAEGLRTVPAA